MMKNISPKWLAPLVLCLFSLVCFGCGNDNDSESEEEESAKTTKSKGAGTPAPTKKSALSQEKAQAAADSFFRDFTLALRLKNPARATSFVAEDYKYNFDFVYVTLQGAKFTNPRVVKINLAGDLIDVRVNLEWPSRQRETKTKQLKLEKGKWRLLETK